MSATRWRRELGGRRPVRRTNRNDFWTDEQWFHPRARSRPSVVWLSSYLWGRYGYGLTWLQRHLLGRAAACLLLYDYGLLPGTAHCNPLKQGPWGAEPT